MNRHEARIFLMETVYQHRLLKNDLLTTFKANHEDEVFDDFINQILDDIQNKEENYIEEITSHLKKWSFDRLNLVDQAILLVSVSELKLGLNDKAVIINEALKISKKYSDPDNYRYINGVLDNIL